MIGGDDIVLEGRALPGERALILAAIATMWPKALFEDADSSDPGPIMVDALRPGPASDEIFAYRDRESFVTWHDCGATAENFNSMVHVIFAQEHTTWVVGERESDVGRIVVSLAVTLRSLRADAPPGQTSHWLVSIFSA